MPLIKPGLGIGPGRFTSGVLASDTTPVVSLVSPNSGRIAGGLSVTITGLNFTGTPVVRFGGVAATSVVLVSSTSITCVTPAATTDGVVDVTVTCGTQVGTLVSGFTYFKGIIVALVPAYGPLAGGTSVIVTGFNFVTGSTITFAGAAGTDVTFIDSQTFSVVTPNHAVGFVDVVITEPLGAQVTLRSGFQYTLLTRANDIRRMPGISIRDVLNNAPNQCTFVIDGQSNTPVVGEKIVITDERDSSRRLFAGTVQTIEQVYEEITNQLAWQATAIDFTWLLNKYRPFGAYQNVSVSSIVVDLIAKYAPGFTTNHVQTKLAKVSVTFDGNDDFATCLNKLASAIGGGHWNVDYDQDVHFFHRLPEGLIIPQTSGPGTAMTVTEGAGIPTTFAFPIGFYLFRSTFVYDNGVESAMSPVSNCVALQGTNQISFAGVPIGAAIGTHTVVKRRLYYTQYGPLGGVTLERFLEINDNVTAAFTTYFGTTGASVATIVALPATVAFPPVSVSVPATGPAGVLGAAQGSAAIYRPQYPPLVGEHLTASYTPARYQFKVTNIYRDGSESLPSVASNSVDLDGISSALLSNVPIGPTVNGLDVVARKVYASWGSTNSVPLSVVVANLQASKNRGGLHNEFGYIIGYGDADNLQGRVGPVPSDYVALANIIGYGDLNYLLNPYGDPDWSPDKTTMWYLIADNTTTSVNVGPGTGSGTPPVNSNAASNIPVWPNPDGPYLEDTDPPEDITSASTNLLRDPPLTVHRDQSQIRNRVFVKGAGVAVLDAAKIGDRVIQVTDLSNFSSGGGKCIVDGWLKLEYYGTSAPSGAGNLLLRLPLAVGIAQGVTVSIFFQADDLISQRVLGKIELDTNGQVTNGVHEYMVVDTSLVNQFQLYMRAYAELELFAYPIVTVHYGTRDPKTKSGQTVHIDLSDPPCFGDFLIQDVTIDQVHDESDDIFPRYTVTASSVKFELNDLLMQILGANSDTGSPLTGIFDAVVTSAALDVTTPHESLSNVINRSFIAAWVGVSAALVAEPTSAWSERSGVWTPVQDSVGFWRRGQSTSIAAESCSGTVAAWFEHLPFLQMKVRTRSASDITGITWWLGFGQTVDPQLADTFQASGVPQFGAGLRFSSAVDGGLVPWSSTGVAGGQVTYPTLLALQANTIYTITFTVLSTSLMQISVNGTTTQIAIPALALGRPLGCVNAFWSNDGVTAKFIDFYAAFFDRN